MVWCKDTPGFIANRIGAFWIQSAAVHAVEEGLTVEEADAVMGRPLGIPKTGIFGLLDLVGLDLQPHVDASLAAQLPKSDPYQALRRDWPLFDKMIAEGYTGRKGKAASPLVREGEEKRLEAIDLKTGQYRPKQEARLESVAAAKAGLKALVENPTRADAMPGACSGLLSYAAWWRRRSPTTSPPSMVPCAMATIGDTGPSAHRPAGADIWPSAWREKLPVPPLIAKAAEAGGFYREREGEVEELGFDGAYRPIPRPPGVLLLADIKRAGKALAANGSASLWDIGDGVACLEFHSKMNSIDPDSFQLLRQSLDLVGKRKLKALVIYNEGENFSVGLNLGLALFSANLAMWAMIEDMVATGQQTYKTIKYSAFPVVGAPSGMALGGGCEILLHCAAVVAHAESYIGLVEAGVGLVPGWGGCKELLARSTAHPKGHGPMPPVAATVETISTAKVACSAAEAKQLGFSVPATRSS